MNNTFKILPALLASIALTACGIDEATVVQAEGDDVWVQNDEALTTKGKFETFSGKDGQFYFHLLAGNGEKVLASQGYATQASAESGIASVKANGQDASKFLLREASDGSWYFVVTAAANGQIIGVSEMYVSQSNATRAMTAVANVVKTTIETQPAPTSNAKFEIFKGLDSKYYFHVRALNGQIVLQSQAYTTKTSATNGTESVQANGATATRYTVLAAADGQYYVVLKAANGQIIARSETYVSKYNAQRAVTGMVELLTVNLPRG